VYERTHVAKLRQAYWLMVINDQFCLNAIRQYKSTRHGAAAVVADDDRKYPAE